MGIEIESKEIFKTCKISNEFVTLMYNCNESRLRQYADLLSSYGGRIRLTGPIEKEVILDEHIVDCLYAVPFLPNEGKVVDVGTGGGLPGIVWAICRPDLRVCLVESVKKKCAALVEITAALRLDNVEVVNQRCEEHAVVRREAYSCATARALSSLDILLEYLAPLLSRGGRVIAFKGIKHDEEVAPIRDKWHLLGLANYETYEYSVEGKKRFLLLWEKSRATPDAFPRRVGLAEKRRWWRCKL